MQNPSVWSVWRATGFLFRRSPAVLVPFLILAVLESVFLAVLAAAPRPPVSWILGPPIRVFFGEGYLHYPEYLFLLPQLFHYARLALGILIGPWLAGTAALLAYRRAMNPADGSTWGGSARAVFSKYPSFLLLVGASIVFSTWGAGLFAGLLDDARGFLREADVSLPAFAWAGAQLAAGIAVGTFVQALFIFAVPSVAIERTTTWEALRRSVALSFRRPAAAFFLTAVPSLFYFIALLVGLQLQSSLAESYPEAAVWASALGIAASFAANAFLVCSASLFLACRVYEENAESSAVPRAPAAVPAAV